MLMSHWSPYQPPEDGLPPQEVRILELRAELWPDDSRRVRIHLEITPFLERPDIACVITGPKGAEAASISIIETIESRMTFTMHLRGEDSEGQFTLQATLSYQNTGMIDQKSVVFDVAGPAR